MITMAELEKRILHGSPMTAAELETLLLSCPEWVQQKKERDEKHRASAEQRMAEMKPEMDPLLADLRAVGYNFESLTDFVNTDQSYPDAIPVFLRHLPVVQHPVIRDMIARSLTVKEARGVAGPVVLAELQKKTDEGETRWALANTLTVVATREDLLAIEALLAKPEDEGVRERLEKAAKSAAKRKR